MDVASALRLNPARATIEGLARHESMRYVPNKPEAVYMVVVLRIDDLLILAATAICFQATSLCCNKRELLPFVT